MGGIEKVERGTDECVQVKAISSENCVDTFDREFAKKRNRADRIDSEVAMIECNVRQCNGEV